MSDMKLISTGGGGGGGGAYSPVALCVIQVASPLSALQTHGCEDA